MLIYCNQSKEASEKVCNGKERVHAERFTITSELDL